MDENPYQPPQATIAASDVERIRRRSRVAAVIFFVIACGGVGFCGLIGYLALFADMARPPTAVQATVVISMGALLSIMSFWMSRRMYQRVASLEKENESLIV
jgi:hypothetical protein